MNLLTAHTPYNLLERGFHIRHATLDDIDTCDTIARQYPQELAFVRKQSLARGVEQQSLHVAVVDGWLVGFVLFHARKDNWNTVYDIAVDRRYAGLGVGRNLLYSVPAPIRLKVTADNHHAVSFYHKCGMLHVDTEPGKARPLHVFELRTLVIFCAGNNKTHPRIAKRAGMAYGCAQFDRPADWPFFSDVEFLPDKQDWGDYIEKVRAWRPVMAMATDYMHPSERDRLYTQIDDLKRAGVLRVLVCPKFEGAIDDIPLDCVVALSAPAKSEKFAGWVPPFSDLQKLNGRRVHILGGSPHRQAQLISRVRHVGGIVSSVDGNSFQRAATTSAIWQDGRWYRDTDGAWEWGDLETTMAVSGANIVRYINQPERFLTAGSPMINRKRQRARQLKLPQFE